MTTPDDVELLAGAGADLAGLWYGIPGGHADLRAGEVTALAQEARGTRRLRPVLVTFLSDVNALREVLDASGIGWLQLHAYQPPSVVRAIREVVAPEVVIVKVLHVRGGECLERPLIPSYERAGTDVFLLDAVTEDGRVGSTGRRIPEPQALGLVDRLTIPFLLAGGITADNRGEYASLVEHPRFIGVDVDTAARDHRGVFRPSLIRQITRGWRTARYDEENT
ncbi:N-(5'-phosphoribosyl)anthranilate isomerase [Streptosporangium sp. NPDC051023]|uniref:phosphoribosylanthranilate isomerase n=1 Tax=Streptosporangium sp. NPDC051023 TaxID=3155410 RepID=UPI00345055E6